MLHIYRQIRSLRAYRPLVICQKRENAEAFPFEDLIVTPKPLTHQLRRLWQKTLLKRPITIYRSEARRLAAFMADREASVLHIYFGHIGVHLLPYLRIAQIPVIVSFHGADAQVGLEHPQHKAATEEMLRLASRLLVRSESLRERLLALGARPEKITLHRTGLPLTEIPRVERSWPQTGAWRCLQACRLIPKKGLATSLRAFAAFRQTWPLASLSIAGEGPGIAALQTLATELGIATAVRFTGFLSQVELRKECAAAHLFLHPSEMGADGDQEGVPNSMLEAMASGLPVAATLHGGIPEAVQHGVSGLLVPERDHAALAVAMQEIVSSREHYRAMSTSAARSVRESFDITAQARVLEGIYTDAIRSSLA